MRRILQLWITLIVSAYGTQTLGLIGDNPNQSQSLSLKATTKGSSICFGENLTVEMELKNRGGNKIVINSEMLWSFITFRAYKPSKFPGVKDARVLMLSPPLFSHPKDDFVVLKPNQVYKSIKTVSLDNQFFREESEVEFDVSYQQLEQREIDGVNFWAGLVNSNKLKLHIKPCISDKKKSQ